MELNLFGAIDMKVIGETQVYIDWWDVEEWSEVNWRFWHVGLRELKWNQMEREGNETKEES